MKKEDFLLLQIYRSEKIEFTPEIQIVLKKLKDEGLIKTAGSKYELTKQGEHIRSLGYKTYQKKVNLENEIIQYGPSERKMNGWIMAITIFLLLVLTFVLLFIVNTLFKNY